MRRARAVSAALGAALAVGFLAVGAPTAADQPAPLYGLRPALAGRTTLAGGHYSYALPAGAHANDAVDVVNFSAGPLTVNLYSANLATTAQGVMAPGQPGDPPTGATSWLTLREATLSLAPRTDNVDRFSLAIPRGTPPGDYLAAIVGARAGGPTVSGDLVVQSRVALIVRVTVLGKTDAQLSLGHLRARNSGRAETLSLTVTNNGNTLMNVKGAVTVRMRSHQREVALEPADIYVIPGGQTRLTGTWRRLPFLGRARLDAVVTASVDNKEMGTYRAPTLTVLFVPWLKAAVGVGIVGVLALSWALTRKRRAAWRTRRADERRVLADYRASQRPLRNPSGAR